MNYKDCIQHCRALLSQHSFARNSFEIGKKNGSQAPKGKSLDLSIPVVIPDEDILEKYLKENKVPYSQT
jgi:hypothetical protein